MEILAEIVLWINAVAFIAIMGMASTCFFIDRRDVMVRQRADDRGMHPTFLDTLRMCRVYFLSSGLLLVAGICLLTGVITMKGSETSWFDTWLGIGLLSVPVLFSVAELAGFLVGRRTAQDPEMMNAVST